MRGDRPLRSTVHCLQLGFTPHARGSTVFSTPVIDRIRVYPACAGIDPHLSVVPHRQDRLPRMRGDRPRHDPQKQCQRRFTPHARGSTKCAQCYQKPRTVYPACAGIDPCYFCPVAPLGCLPRMRGDRPQIISGKLRVGQFTPHARGSTPFQSPL